MKEIKILALGSSITRGYGNHDISFVEMLNEIKDEGIKFNVYKEAINGTTLANRKDNSYLARLRKLDLTLLKTFDYVLVQLSTNDLHLLKNRLDLNDEKTTFGAIIEIIKYIKENTNAKTIFYTCFTKRNKKYENMIETLKTIKENCGFSIIDFYENEEMRKAKFRLIMSDNIHPNKEGYIIMSKYLAKYFKADINN